MIFSPNQDTFGSKRREITGPSSGTLSDEQDRLDRRTASHTLQSLGYSAFCSVACSVTRTLVPETSD